MNRFNENTKQVLEQERYEVLRQIENWLDLPMLFLSFIWLVLFIVESVWELTSFLDTLQLGIWMLFILDFGLEFMLTPSKITYLKRNWLIVLSLLLPALRLFRFTRTLGLLRGTQGIRGVRMLQIVTRTNQGMRSMTESFRRRGFGYIVILTVFVVLVGSVGIYLFERDIPDTGLSDYGTALWWTAMMITTMGSDSFPKTSEGRLLCLILAVYAFAMFGYLSASLASFFVGQDAGNPSAEVAGEEAIANLQNEITALREELQAVLRRKVE